MQAVADRMHKLIATEFHAELHRFFESPDPRKKAAVIEDAEKGVPGAQELLDYYDESERERAKRRNEFESQEADYRQGLIPEPGLYKNPLIQRDESNNGSAGRGAGESTSRIHQTEQGVRGISEQNIRRSSQEDLQNAEVVPDPTVPMDLSFLRGYASRRTKKPQTATDKEVKKLEKQLKKEAEQQAAQEGLKQQPGAEQAKAGTILEKGIPNVLNERVEAMSPNNPTKPAMQHLATFVRYLGELGRAAKMSLFKFTDSLVKDVEPYIPSAKSWYQAVIDSAKKVNEIRDNGLKIGDAF